MINFKNEIIKQKLYFEKCDDEILNKAIHFIKNEEFTNKDKRIKREAVHISFLIIESLCKSIHEYNKDMAKEIAKLPVPYLGQICIKDEGTTINQTKFILFRDLKAHMCLLKLNRIIQANDVNNYY